MQTITVFAYEPVTPQRIDLSTIESLLKNKNLLNLLAQNYDEFEPDYSGNPFGDTEQEDIEGDGDPFVVDEEYLNTIDPFADDEQSSTTASTKAETKSGLSCEYDARRCIDNALWTCVNGTLKKYLECHGKTPRCVEIPSHNTAICVPPEDLSLEEGYTCGDGIVGKYEECDDGNDNDLDECTSVCTKAKCNDGIEQDSEECDPPHNPYCLSNCTIGYAPPACTNSAVDALIGQKKKLTAKKLDVVFESLEQCFDTHKTFSLSALTVYPKHDSHTVEGLWTKYKTNEQYEEKLNGDLEDGKAIESRIEKVINTINAIKNNDPGLVRVDPSVIDEKFKQAEKWKVHINSIRNGLNYLKKLNREDYFDKVNPVVEEAAKLVELIESTEKKRKQELEEYGYIISSLSNADVERIISISDKLKSEIPTLIKELEEEIESSIEVRVNNEFPELKFSKSSVKEYTEDYLRSLLKALNDTLEQIEQIDVSAGCSIIKILANWGVTEPELSKLSKEIDERYGEEKLKQFDSRVVLAKAVPKEICEKENLAFCKNEIDTVLLARLLGSDTPYYEWGEQYRALLPSISADESGALKSTLPELQVRALIADRNLKLFGEKKIVDGKEVSEGGYVRELQSILKAHEDLLDAVLKKVGNGSSALDEFAVIVNNAYEYSQYISPLVIAEKIVSGSCGETETYTLPSTNFNEGTDKYVKLILSKESQIEDLKSKIEETERELYQLGLAHLAYQHGGLTCDAPEEKSKEIFNIWVNGYGNELDEINPYFTGLLEKAWRELDINNSVGGVPSNEFYKNLRKGNFSEAADALIKGQYARDNIYGGSTEDTLNLFFNLDPSVKYISEIALDYFESSTEVQQLLVAGTAGTKSEEYIAYAKKRADRLKSALDRFKSVSSGQHISNIRNIVNKFTTPEVKKFYPKFYARLVAIDRSIDYIERNHDVEKVIELIYREDFKSNTWANWSKQELPRLLAAIALGVVGGVACAFYWTGVGAIACMAVVGTMFGMFGYRTAAELQYRYLGIGLGANFYQYIRGEYILDKNGNPIRLEFGAHVLDPAAVEFITGVAVSFVALGLGRVFVSNIGPIVSKIPWSKGSPIVQHLQRVSALAQQANRGTSAQREVYKHFLRHYMYEFGEELSQEGVLEPGVEQALNGALSSLDLKLGGLERIIPPLVSTITEGLSVRGGSNVNTLHYNSAQREALIASLQNNGFDVVGGDNGEFFATLREADGQVQGARLHFIPEISNNADVTEIINSTEYNSLLDITSSITIQPSSTLPTGINARTTVIQDPTTEVLDSIGEQALDENGRIVIIEVDQSLVNDLTSTDDEVKQRAIKIINEELAHARDTVIDPRAPCVLSLEHYVALRTFKELTARAVAEGKAGNVSGKVSIGEELRRIKTLIDDTQYEAAYELSVTVLTSLYGASVAAMYTNQYEQDYNQNINAEDQLIEIDFNINVTVLQVRELEKYIKEGLKLIREGNLKEAVKHFRNTDKATELGLSLKTDGPSHHFGTLESMEDFNKALIESVLRGDGIGWHFDRLSTEIVLGVYSISTENTLEIQDAILYEICLSSAEEWIHALQNMNYRMGRVENRRADKLGLFYVSSLASVLYQATSENLYSPRVSYRKAYPKWTESDEEVNFKLLYEFDVGAFFEDNGVELTEPFLERYFRSEVRSVIQSLKQHLENYDNDGDYTNVDNDDYDDFINGVDEDQGKLSDDNVSSNGNFDEEIIREITDFKDLPPEIQESLLSKLGNILKGELVSVLDDENGSTAIVFVGTIEGLDEEVAIKVYRGVEDISDITGVHDSEEDIIQLWTKFIDVLISEINALKILEALGIGPKFYGVVDIDGNPAVGMERINGLDFDSNEIDPSIITDEMIERGLATIRKLVDAGYFIHDFQYLIVTQNGNGRKVGDIVITDPSGLVEIDGGVAYADLELNTPEEVYDFLAEGFIERMNEIRGQDQDQSADDAPYDFIEELPSEDQDIVDLDDEDELN